MKDTFMNNQMILIKFLLKDLKTSYLPTTEVALSPCPLSPWLSADRARERLLFSSGGGRRSQRWSWGQRRVNRKTGWVRPTEVV